MLVCSGDASSISDNKIIGNKREGAREIARGWLIKNNIRSEFNATNDANVKK